MPLSRGALALAGLALACGRGSPPSPSPTPMAKAPADSFPPAGSLPPVPPVRGPLELRVVYPPPDAVLQIRDSSFLLGTAGTGAATVMVNGQPARVWPNGAWLAYVALPHDSIMPIRIEARAGSDSTAIDYPIRRVVPETGRVTVGAAWVDTLSLTPSGRVWLGRDEYLTLGVRAADGARVRLRLPDGTEIPLSPQPGPLEVPADVRAFDRDTTRLRTPVVHDRYVGLLRGRSLGPDPGAILPLPFALGPVDTAWASIEAVVGEDTARARWPLQVAVLDSTPVVAELEDDSTQPGTPDSLTVGRAIPGGTYAWFFPSGTRAAVTGRRNDELRLRLSRDADAWVSVGEARLVSLGEPPPSAIVGSVSATVQPDRVRVRIPLGQRVPFRVEEGERSITVRLYSAFGDVDWMRYGAADSLVRHMSWRQAASDEVTLSFDLARPLWGYRARWDRSDLLLDIRRPPRIDPDQPLRGRLIAVDPGHPPGGAMGPTGLREADANLGVALELQRLLQAAGARVLMTRTADSAVDLWPRVALAESAGADLLISIHNNALPDGINPFTNNGTSVYYNHPRSVPLARAVQTQLVQRLGLRDLGIGLGDLALVRGTWMPSILTEGLFMILPDQEAALRTTAGRRRYAQAVFEGIRDYLREWASEAP
ncbi:MAG: N-acetylmuramoyl-L-alanine amidase family protein [Gemmatimonadales bacterium]